MLSILSLDCATRVCGFSVITQNDVDPPILAAAGTIKLDSDDSMATRFFDFHRQILDLIKKHSPTHVAIEDLKFNMGAPNFGALTKVAMSIGVAQMTAAMAGFDPILITASTVRARIENKAKRDKKDETRKIINLKFKADLTRLGFEAGLLKSHHDISDAIALGWVALSTCPKN
jgi:Holliday junction resolvasome RuvABC endonuclease subunit